MSTYIGFFFCILIAIGAFLAVAAVGLRDGDRAGDAVVRMRLLRVAGGALYAEVAVDNQHDSPVMVSGRTARASVLSLVFGGPHARRTALVHRSGLAGLELLGAVDGRAARRFLLPVAAGTRTVRVVTVVDQVARRTRVVSTTLRAGRALKGVLPADSMPLPRP